ncbi:MFS transporter [Gallibacterium salpingitidis]|uniref:MFS transporter n=1 Tax=Gallibacterium salpingitidis TaxID=505341 RepID=A0AB36DZQ9_9PAST|nr:MFS transporter [Gallibacterium salpingitidis]OBX06388.1 MFS transporter [Gallibacterium salpingitidis]OBX07188.1 MFS transporter [Gallibacterium salpingitidis]WKS98934.1 MFS transporter [Gallibacterium salpingitidis]
MKNTTKEPLWTAEFTGYGISSSVFYIVQYIMVSALPIVITLSYGGSAFDAGMAMTCFQIGCILCRPFAGELIDSLNKKKMLLFSTGLFFLITAAFNFSPSVEFLFIYRFFQGMLFAIGTTVVATVAVLVLPNTRKGEGIGYFAMFVNIAMVIGPFFGLLILDTLGDQALFIACAMIGLIGFYAANRKPLPDTLAIAKPRGNKAWNLARFIESRAFPWALMGLFMSFTYSGILVFVPIMMTTMGIGTLASYFFVIFAVTIVITRPFIGRIYDYYGASYLIYPGYIIFILAMALLSMAESAVGIFIAAPILGLGYGAIAPAFQTSSVQVIPSERAGAATATYFLFLDLGVGLGSVLLSMLVSAFNFNIMYWINTLIALIGLLLYHFVVRSKAKVNIKKL